MLIKISEFTKTYGVCRTSVYAEIAAGRLRALKRGRSTLIAKADADAWAASLPAARS